MLKSQDQLFALGIEEDEDSTTSPPINGVPVPDHLLEKFNMKPWKNMVPVDPRDKWIARMAFKYSPKMRRDPLKAKFGQLHTN